MEKTDVDSKAQLTTHLIVQPALHIICKGFHIEFIACTDGAISWFDWISEQMSAYNPVRRSSHCLQLECPVPASGGDEYSRLKQPSCLDALRLFQAIECSGGINLLLGGYFAFDLMSRFEPAPMLNGDSEQSDYEFYLAESWMVVDHIEQSSSFYTCSPGGASTDWAEQCNQLAYYVTQYEQTLNSTIELTALENAITPDIPDAAFVDWVNTAKTNIQAGDVFQVVLSRSFSYNCPDPLANYLQLREVNFSPYMFYIQINDLHIFGASPETAVKYERDSNQVEVCPIAGTRPRGKCADGSIDSDLDSKLEIGLKQDEKEIAEHLMLVDLCRNDIARISQTGTRQVRELLKVERYSHVMHLVSRVTGQLNDDLDALAAYQACMNMGTLVGAPKVRALQLLRACEGKRRNVYGGAVGILTSDGDMDTCIAIRCAVVQKEVASVQAGAGIVYDSSPEAEAQETVNKARAVFQSQAYISAVN